MKSATPELAPPGAGLPIPELWVARLMFAIKRRRTDRGQAAREFESEFARILNLARSCDADSGSRRVLIERPRGLEDSSRYWSVFMTLDHLRITNGAFGHVVGSLASGCVPKGKANTAAVKPSPDVGIEILESFQDSCRSYQKTASSISSLDTGLKYSHPWFGPLNAADWNLLVGFHMGLHRRQIELILSGIDL